jgi:outer membrane protein assembly factor BamA
MRPGPVIIFFVLLLLLQSSKVLKAQEPTVFRTYTKADAVVMDRLYTNYYRERKGATDSLGRYNALRSAVSRLHASGYLEARLDSIVQNDGRTEAWWYCGPVYRWARLKPGVDAAPVLNSSGVTNRLYYRKVLSPASYARLGSSVLQWCADHGYPFASLRLDSVTIEDAGVAAVLQVDKGPLMLLDSAVIKGDARVSKAYLYNYLYIRPGTEFDESSLRRISTRLKEIPFVTEARPFEIEYLPGLARPVLYLKARKASQFNGVVGLLPDNANPGKVFVTGDVKLRLLNSFSRAELIDLNWSNPQPRTQDLKAKFSYPFLLGLPVGVDADLTLFKRDTIFLEFFRQLGFRYFFAGNNSVRVFAGRRTNNLISTKGYENVNTLPPFADVAVTNYGLGLQLARLDYRFNPRQGFALDLTAGAGVRQVEKNSRINSEVYDSLDLRTTQYRAEGQADVYLPLGRRSVFNLGAMGGWLQSPAIFANELFRFGGLRTLRGFDEQSLLASVFVIGKAEYRFILEQNSYLLLFYNRAWYEDRSRNRNFSDTPYGFGAGLTFDTRLGIFSFNYALGTQQGNPIEFRAAKVHFGLLNFF